ncbi:MAG: hypothetical protein R3E12_03565 [Candidatus Eisenbacteria bacterium]
MSARGNRPAGRRTDGGGARDIFAWDKEAVVAGRMEFEFGFSNRSGRPKDPTQPFALLVLADLSGQLGGGCPGRAQALPIDVDSLDSRFAALFPSVRLSDEIVISFDSGRSPIRCSLQNLEIFRSLRQLQSTPGQSGDLRGGCRRARASAGSAGLEPASDPGQARAAQPADDFQRLLRGGPDGGSASARSRGRGI